MYKNQPVFEGVIREKIVNIIHCKNFPVRFDLERVPFGQTHFWFTLIRNLGETDTKSESKMYF